MPGQVEEHLKKERSAALLELAEESRLKFQGYFIGRTQMVLFEKISGGLCSGVTGNYIKVYTESGKDLTNQLLSTRLIEMHQDGVGGELA
jgi:threonylcarbamoyladenosine tRNA methylthiotransferase MtaB